MTASIIICTYNRPDLLLQAIQGIRDAEYTPVIKEIIVVNNMPTAALTIKLDELPYALRIVDEHQQGLSYARNTGAENAKGEWLLYLDDDGKIEPQTLIEFEKVMTQNRYKFVTGIFTAWDYCTIPKWFPHEWMAYQLKGTKGIRDLDDDYICGNIMAIKKKILHELGGFPTDLGMNGTKTAYGEESYLEQKARRAKIPVGINTNMVLKHVVAKHKHSISWLLSAYYARGKSIAHISDLSWKHVPDTIIQMLVRILKNFLRSSFLFMTKSQYYHQNFILENLGPILSYLAILQQSMQNTKSNEQ